MESSLWSVFVLVVAISVSAINAAKIEDELDASKKIDPNVDQGVNPLDQRVRFLEGELLRMKSHLSEVESLLDAWFLSAEQQPSMTSLNSADAARWLADDNGLSSGLEKRAGGGWSFMGSRGKRKQPFILGSRGKRAANHEPSIDESSLDTIENEMDKRGAYFYGSRGKKRFLVSSLDDTEYRQMPAFNNKRYTFMGSRGKK